MVQRPCKPANLDAASLGGQVQWPALPPGATTVIPEAAKPKLLRAHTGTLVSACSPVATHVIQQQQTPCAAAGGPQLRLMRARTSSMASTSSNLSASPLSSQASVASSVPSYPPGMGWTPLAAAGRLPAGAFFVGSVTPTAYVAAHAIQTPNSGARPYPPGLGYTPHANATTLKGSLQRGCSFGFSADEGGQVPAAAAPASSPAAAAVGGRAAGGLLRKQSTGLASVLEAPVEERQLSREFLLCFRGEPEPTEAAEAGFLWPAPGFILVREEAQSVKVAKPQAAAAGPVAAPAVRKSQGSSCSGYAAVVKQGYPVQNRQWQQQAWTNSVHPWRQQQGYQGGQHNQCYVAQATVR
eukprot:TRINITY_DN32427_c0_g1_i1.p1 TRINITY_DN32427_c0_g1~~TRINITY_DN32427_c0_g1_i1.p1  ORF type:complete len:354 (+),score=83.06 TRINITY_DN32427_c0_g1_i1:43-1104(+)